MEAIKNQVMKIISGMEQIQTLLFECVKREYNDMISDIKDLRE